MSDEVAGLPRRLSLLQRALGGVVVLGLLALVGLMAFPGLSDADTAKPGASAPGPALPPGHPALPAGHPAITAAAGQAASGPPMRPSPAARTETA